MKKKRDKRDNLTKEIDNVLAKMNKLTPDSKEYSAMATNLKTLYEAKGKEKDRHISWDTVAIIGGNLLGIVLILGYEKAGVITSKALNFVLRGRV
jgi:hypothetical protein